MINREVNGSVFPVVILPCTPMANKLKIIDENGVNICDLYLVLSFNCRTEEALIYDRINTGTIGITVSKEKRIIKVPNAKLELKP